MPSNDLVLNVRQISGYDAATSALSTDTVLMQRGGLGGPYASISPADFVGTALSSKGDMTIGGHLSALSISGGSLQFSNGAFGLVGAQQGKFVNFDAQAGSICGASIATRDWVTCNTVAFFNGRTGAVTLQLDDILAACGAPIDSPRFLGEPRADTPMPWSNSTRLATTAFVQMNVSGALQNLILTQPLVFSFNGRSGAIVLTPADIAAGGGVSTVSPAFTGAPTAPTAPPGTNNTQLATTAFVVTDVTNALAGLSTIYAPIISPVFTGTPSGPTAPVGSDTGQLATTAFVTNAIQASTTGVASFNTRTGNVTLTGADLTGAGGALLASPAFTGSPSAPTAAPLTSTGQLATTAFVMAAVTAGAVSSFNTRTGAVTLTAADITGAGGAVLASPAFTGAPTAPTAGVGTSTTQLATTAFVLNEVAAIGAGVITFNGRSGNVTFTTSDLSAVGGAPLASPAFTGSPSAPTATAGTNSTQLATTAFVMAALALIGAGVLSFNGRSGAVTLTTADVTGAGGAVLASPAFTGTPTGPTASVGTLNTQLATTAFVGAALPKARNQARLQAQWVSGATVANDTVFFAYDAPYPGTINSLTYFTGAGSFAVSVQINGVTVTGLSSVAVSSSTSATANATAGNTFVAGNRITGVVTGATGSPTDALLSVAVTWA